MLCLFLSHIVITDVCVCVCRRRSAALWCCPCCSRCWRRTRPIWCGRRLSRVWVSSWDTLMTQTSTHRCVCVSVSPCASFCVVLCFYVCPWVSVCPYSLLGYHMLPWGSHICRYEISCHPWDFMRISVFFPVQIPCVFVVPVRLHWSQCFPGFLCLFPEFLCISLVLYTFIHLCMFPSDHFNY